MPRSDRTRSLVALAIAAAHLVVLAILGLSAPIPPGGWNRREPPVFRVTLTPELRRKRPPPPPRSARPSPASAAQPLQVHVPAAAPAAGTPSLPIAQAGPGPVPSLNRGFRDYIGCEHRDLYRMDPAERARCDVRLAEQAKLAGVLPVTIDPAKRSAFDRSVRCRTFDRDAPVPIGAADNARQLLGNFPSLKDCGPQDR